MKFNEIKIQKPKNVKIVDITDDVYFSSEYSDYISNSKLSLINPDEGGSPEKYKSGLSNNKIYSNALEFGSALHQLVLQPNEFHLVEDIDKPSGKLSFMADYILAKGLSLSDEDILISAKEVDYFKGNLSSEKIEEVRNKIVNYYNYMINIDSSEDLESVPIYLSSYDRFRCQSCMNSVTTHPSIQKLLYPSDSEIFNEATFLSEFDVTFPDGKSITLKFKGKLDNYTVNDEVFILNDLKSTGKELSQFQNSFNKYRYGRQVGIYLYFLKFIYPNVKKVKANILAVETIKPFTANVIQITLDSIIEGVLEAQKLIKMIAFYEVYGYDKILSDYYE